jgi:hypothetical protein
MLLFALGHMLGFVPYLQPEPGARHVLELMQSAPVEKQGRTLTFNEFYFGIGQLVSAYQVFLAAVAISIGRMLRMGTGVPQSLGWLFALIQAVTLALSWIHFSTPPIAVSAALTVVATAAVLQGRRAGVWNHVVNTPWRPAPVELTAARSVPHLHLVTCVDSNATNAPDAASANKRIGLRAIGRGFWRAT